MFVFIYVLFLIKRMDKFDHPFNEEGKLKLIHETI